jgi:NAD(P)-dependent dehydrogenase (short-subunit alcohol dehydrogenase family)
MVMNKRVFITGGDKGIGRALTERMVAQGHKVAFTYNTNLKGAEDVMSQNPGVESFQCDLSDRQQSADVVRRVLGKWGSVDILINNAGYDNDAVFVKMTMEQWDAVLDVNLRSMFYFTHGFAKAMAENGWGRIINLTSIAGSTGAFGKSNYAAAKAGVVGFTKSLALELGGKGITSNAIAPGAIETDMLMRIPEKYRAEILRAIPAKRFGTTEEVADLVEFLVSDKAAYINGQTIHINGGSYLV